MRARCKVRTRTQLAGPARRARPRRPGRDGDMGRGRQKAKDAKIARQLKYTNHGGDLRELERELISTNPHPQDKPSDDEDYVDRWADDED